MQSSLGEVWHTAFTLQHLCFIRNICTIMEGKWKERTVASIWTRWNGATKEINIMKEGWKQIEGGHKSWGLALCKWVLLRKLYSLWKAFIFQSFFWPVPTWKPNLYWIQSLEFSVHLLLSALPLGPRYYRVLYSNALFNTVPLKNLPFFS